MACHCGHSLTSYFVFVVQTDKVREEFSEDMSITRAFSIVFERNPELRYHNSKPHLFFIFSAFDTVGV